jgi:hypothetical protein
MQELGAKEGSIEGGAELVEALTTRAERPRQP